MSIEQVKEFYELAKTNSELKNELGKIDTEINIKNISSNNLQQLVEEKIVPLAKNFNLNITADELIYYVENKIKNLSEEEISMVSGGLSAKSAAIGLATVMFLSSGITSLASASSTQGTKQIYNNNGDNEFFVDLKPTNSKIIKNSEKIELPGDVSIKKARKELKAAEETLNEKQKELKTARENAKKEKGTIIAVNNDKIEKEKATETIKAAREAEAAAKKVGEEAAKLGNNIILDKDKIDKQSEAGAQKILNYEEALKVYKQALDAKLAAIKARKDAADSFKQAEYNYDTRKKNCLAKENELSIIRARLHAATAKKIIAEETDVIKKYLGLKNELSKAKAEYDEKVKNYKEQKDAYENLNKSSMALRQSAIELNNAEDREEKIKAGANKREKMNAYSTSTNAIVGVGQAKRDFNAAKEKLRRYEEKYRGTIDEYNAALKAIKAATAAEQAARTEFERLKGELERTDKALKDTIFDYKKADKTLNEANKTLKDCTEKLKKAEENLEIAGNFMLEDEEDILNEI